MNSKDLNKLITWYEEVKRPLPWRQTKDPYAIWISEVMLQQTTTTAVVPFYERFLQRFPDIKSLAEAQIEDIYPLWAGLGYYSRARNILKSAQAIHAMGYFPKTAAALIELPGFGPYISRAVASFAFHQAVGVLDGNVIRVLTRKYNNKGQWWKNPVRNELQKCSDSAAQLSGKPEVYNQAIMELGATICTPKNPHCIQCPWLKNCEARKAKTVSVLPLKKPTRPIDIWLWQPEVLTKNGKIYFIKNNYAPFLKNSWFLPGTAKKIKSKPARYDFCHSITHHKIYVQINVQPRRNTDTILSVLKNTDSSQWVPIKKITQFVPASLIQKALKHADE